jgi:hypothetical protein
MPFDPLNIAHHGLEPAAAPRTAVVVGATMRRRFFPALAPRVFRRQEVPA